jgi:uncharacterized protein DUF1707
MPALSTLPSCLVTDSDAQHHLPEPIPMRVGDNDRQQVVHRLEQAYSEGRLTLEEFSERTSAAWAAKTTGDLAPLTHDLPTGPIATSTPAVLPGAPLQPVHGLEPAERSTTVAIMGGRDVKGRWRPARRNNVVAVMGGATLDLRAAEFNGPEIAITYYALMGGGEIIVPEGVRVEFAGGFAFMGGHSENIADVPTVPGTPVVRIKVFALMGGVDIKSRPVVKRAGSD